LPRPTISLDAHQRQSVSNNYGQFKGNNFLDGRSFVIAVGDAGLLQRKMNCRVDTLPGFARADSLIVTRPNGHRELWANPRMTRYRDAHFAFFDALGIYLPASIAKVHDSDHAFPKSAASPDVGLVKMNFIDQGSNRSHGSAWESRFTEPFRTMASVTAPSWIFINQLEEDFCCLAILRLQ